MKKRIGTDLFATVCLYDTDGNTLDISNTYDRLFYVNNKEYPISVLCNTISVSANIITFQYTALLNTIVGTFDGLFSYKRANTDSTTGYILTHLDLPDLFEIVQSTEYEDTAGQSVTYKVPIIDYLEQINNIENNYVTKLVYTSSIELLTDSIATKVSQTDYNSLEQVVSNHTSSILLNANAITTKVSTTDYTGATVASLINQSADTITIQAEHLNLTGSVLFSDLANSTVTTISGYAVSSVTDLKDDLGVLAYKNTVEAAELGTTIIDGGYIKSSLIDTSGLIVSASLVSGIGALALMDTINTSYITGLGTLATQSTVTTSDLDTTLSNTISSASTTASTALSTANTAASNASSAVTTANSASSTASSALSTANNVSTSLTNLLSSLKALAYKDTITSALVTDLGTLATLDSIGLTNLDATIVSGGKILTNLIVANEVLVNALAAGTIVAGNATITNLSVSNATILSSTLTDVSISGSFVSPFLYTNTSSSSYAAANNIALSNAQTATITSGVDKVGRRLTISMYKDVDGNEVTGSSTIQASGGEPIYEDGASHTSISISREAVELLGLGTSTTFYGWLVLNRVNTHTTGIYGRKLQVIGQGSVIGGSSSATFDNSWTFDGSTMSVSRISTGLYRITMPWTFSSSSYYMVMITGWGSDTDNSNAPIKGTLKTKTVNTFDVWTSDDSSVNDGNFLFLIFNITQ